MNRRNRQDNKNKIKSNW